MIKIAIVEDEEQASSTLKNMMEKYREENTPSSVFDISIFSSAEAFLADYRDYEVIFLDIQMGGMNGMDAAREIRKRDENVMIVFVTNMSQYAIESYEVEAYDFILKPVTYGNFFMKFRRILKKLAHTSNEEYISLNTRFETRKVKIKDILYIESYGHNIIFHLENGDEIKITGTTMNDWEKKLKDYYFIRINSGFLVNLKYTSAVRGEYVQVKDKELHISRSKRQNLMTAFARYVGGSV